MKGDPFSKEQQGIFSIAQVSITLASCQLLVDAAQVTIHCLHACAKEAQPVLLQFLPLLLQPVASTVGNILPVTDSLECLPQCCREGCVYLCKTAVMLSPSWYEGDFMRPRVCVQHYHDRRMLSA